jgi:hypothetical protein
MNSEFLTPCVNCGRKDSQSPLSLDRSEKFHICRDSLSCLREIKRQGLHTFYHGTGTQKQRQYAFELAQQRGVDLHAFIERELELNDALKVSQKAMSAIIQGLLSRQIKANRAA